MLRIVKTKDGREFRSYTDTHAEIVLTDHLSYSNVSGEYFFEAGKLYDVRRPTPDKIQIARDIDALYAYDYYKDNQGLRIGD